MEDMTQSDAGAVAASGTDAFFNVLDRLAQSGAYIVSAVRGGNRDRDAAPYGRRETGEGLSRGAIIALVVGGVAVLIGLVFLFRR